MKSDYDVDRRAREGLERTFSLAGHAFTAKPAMGAREVGLLADHQATVSTTGRLALGYYDALVSVIRATLLPGCRDEWDALLEEDLESPITLAQLSEIADDLVQDTAGRPPQPRSPSGSTDERVSTRSTDVSDSLAAPVSTISPSAPV